MNLCSAFRLFLVSVALGAAGCASIPAPLAGEYSESFQPAQASEASIGARVRWGGLVIETRPERDRTCIELLAQPLDGSKRPDPSDADLGRFIACRAQFYDPEIFVNGREVTVVGRLEGFTTGAVGKFQYRYPNVAADAIYLWPERVVLPPSYHYYSPWPYYPGFWPYWGYPRPWRYWHDPWVGVRGSARVGNPPTTPVEKGN